MHYAQYNDNMLNMYNIFNVKFMLRSKNYQAAFTLAEVLVTLGLIGIVAAMTLPSLIGNYQKKQTAIRLKEAYSLLNQAIQQSELKNGEINSWNFGTAHGNVQESVEFIDTYIAPFLKVTNKCYNRCIPKVTKHTLSGKEYRFYLEDKTYYGRSIFIANGMQIWVYTDSDEAIKIAGIVVDINADRAPNLVGRDIFFFELKNNSTQVTLQGYKNSREVMLNNNAEGCNTTAGNVAGRYCGALIQHDGWEIREDYPWKNK